jgi:hypothetical protein
MNPCGKADRIFKGYIIEDFKNFVMSIYGDFNLLCGLNGNDYISIIRY